VVHVFYVPSSKQNLTVRLDRRTIQQAKRIAAERNSSISAIVAERIESLVGERAAYEQAKRRALELLDQGFHMGPVPPFSRDELHER